MRWSDADATFLVTSDDTLPARAFLGHAFVGDDLVIGAEGDREFQRVRGQRVGGGQDGAYVALAAQPDGSWLLSSDHKGFSHVFHWSDDRHWAVSNSWKALVQHLGDRGTRLDPSMGSLAAWVAAPDMVRSLMAFETAIEGVHLLPTNAGLRLRPGVSPSLVVEQAASGAMPPATYGQALVAYLDCWTARFQTMAAHPHVGTTLHLTGGLDSRTVVAMALSGLHSVDLAAAGISIVSQENRAEDFAVASTIAARLGVALNARLPDELTHPVGRHARPADRYLAWEELMLGNYGHVMFPPNVPTPTPVMAPGVGGEAHRHPYRPRMMHPTIADVAEVLRPRFTRSDDFEQWRDAMVAADDWLRLQPGAHAHPLVRNHREFRDRFHTGKTTAWATNAIALAGRGLVDCSNRLPDDAFGDGQLFYDIMATVGAGELATMPYDRAAKSPTSAQLARVPDIDWSPPRRCGRVFMADEQAERPSVVPEARAHWPLPDADSPLECLRGVVERAADNPDVAAVLGQGVVDDACATLRRRVDGARMNLHGAGRSAHAVVLTEFVLDACG